MRAERRRCSGLSRASFLLLELCEADLAMLFSVYAIIYNFVRLTSWSIDIPTIDEVER